MRALTVFVILLASILLCTCHNGGGASHKLPADWPVSQLTLDPDWQLQRPATAMHQLDPAQYPEPIWLVVFDKEGDWPGVVTHVESCLKPLNWLRSKEKGLSNPLGLDLPETRTYYSPDYLTEVYLSNGAYFDVLVNIDVEFAMQIKQYIEPPELIKVCLSHQQRDPKLSQALLDGILEPIT
jgi:hypothetical protein